MSDSTTAKTVDKLFYRPIRRQINEVVKVDDDNPEVVRQELEEYVLTPQLEKHFSEALETVIETEHAGTNDIGMWISGFFGSGKSHFMKILGYLLEDREIDNTHAAEVFRNRIESDKMLDGMVGSVTSKFNSEVLMFQIGAKASATGSDSITETIHREFNTNRGYASMPWVAKMEQELEERGIFDAFVDAIEDKRGDDWSNIRSNAMFVRSDMASALAKVSDEFDTEEDAHRAIEDVEDNVVITAASLAEDITAHVEAREEETGENCRYFVFIDEISQFIGDDSDRLLQLQSIVEQFGQHGNGNVFLGVTSQEQLEDLVPGILEEKAAITKVIDRFPHRYQLISDNLDKVVRDRILKKDGSARGMLGDLYDDNDAILTARYKLDSSRALKQISRENFIDCYPFLPYQLDILPRIFEALRGEGSDDRLTGHERTLIDVTQSVLKDDEQLFGAQLGQLVTLDMIFDEVSDDVPDIDVQSIRSANPEDADADTAQRVLKALYLLQELDWLANSTENIATTLQPEIGATHELESEVQEALDALVDAGYVGHDEEGYRFLRETERKLENEIKGIKVRGGDIRRSSKRYLRDVLDGATKISYQGQSFDLSTTVDGEEISSSGHVNLVAYSPVQQYYEEVDERSIKTRSHNEEDTVYWIANNEDDNEIRDMLKLYQQTDTVLKAKRSKELSAEEQEAIGQKQEGLQRLKDDIERKFERSFKTGTLIYHGTATELDDTDRSLNRHVTGVAQEAIKRVFTKLDHGLAIVKDRHVEQIFGDLDSLKDGSVFTELGLVQDGELIAEARVASDVVDEIIRREREGESRTGSDLVAHFAEPPYGWSRDVVRLATAALFRNGSVIATHKERTYGSYTDSGAQERFTQVTKFNQTSFNERETVDPQTRTDAKSLLDRLFDQKVKATDQAIDNAIQESATNWASRTSTLLPQLRRTDFPLIDEVDQFNTLLENLSAQPTSAKRIKQFVKLESELEQLMRTVEAVYDFCGGDEEGDGNLGEYETIQRFTTTEWADLLDEAASSASLVAIDDDAREAAKRVKGNLDSEGIIDAWTDVTTDYGTAASEFLSIYEQLYKRRRTVYTDAIEDVRSYAGDGVEDIDHALEDLVERRGSQSIERSVSNGDHISPNPTLTRLIEHIQTVDSYKSSAMEAVDELQEEDDEDDTVRERVDLGKIFSGVVVTDASELDEPIAELREEVEALLDNEKDVEIRFR